MAAPPFVLFEGGIHRKRASWLSDFAVKSPGTACLAHSRFSAAE